MNSSEPVDSFELLSSIGDVSRLTGISETTLRVWERRYAFPRTERSAGGHRQYSERDVLRLLWVRMQMERGMRASTAIRAQNLMRRNDAVAAALTEPLPPCVAPDPAIVAAQSLLLEALLAFDSAKAQEILDELAERHPLASVVLDVIGPTLVAIGESWATGDTGITVEHFATNFLRHQLLRMMQVAPAPYEAPPIVLACAPEELHEGGLLMLGALLREMRWPVVYLGQSLPLADIATLVQQVRPALIVFAALSEVTAMALADWPQSFAQSDEAAEQMPIIGYGGRAFSEHPELVERVSGVLLGATICEGSQRINRIMLHLSVLQD